MVAAVSLLRQASPLVVGRAASAVVTFAIPLALARLLEPAEFGGYKQFFLVATTAQLLLQFGLAQSLYYFVPRNRTESAKYLSAAVLLLGIIGAATTLLLGLSGPLLGRLMHNTALTGLAPWLGIYTGCMIVSTPLEISLIAHKRLAAAAVVFLASDLLRTAAIVLPVFFTGRLEELVRYAALFATLRAVVCLVVTVAARSREGAPARRSAAGRTGAVRELLAYALPFGAAAVFIVVQANWHQYAVAYHYSAAVFAVYAVGCFNVPIVDLVYTPVVEVMMVRMAEVAGQGDPPQARRAAAALFAEASVRLALLFFPFAVVLVAFAPDIIRALFTPTYVAAVPIFVIATLELPLAALPVDGVLRAHAQTRFLFLANVARLVLTVALVGLGMRLPGSQLGMMGAIGGFVLAQLITKGVMIRRCARILGTMWTALIPTRALAQILGGAVACAFPALATRATLAGHGVGPFWRAGGGGVVYLATCGAVAYWARDMLKAMLPPIGRQKEEPSTYDRKPLLLPAGEGAQWPG